MRLEELDFIFPEELIAQQPAEPRDSCRLMHLAGDGSRSHEVFTSLPRLLSPGDILVFNDSRVLPARVQAVKPSGGRVELLFIRALDRSGAVTGDGTTGSCEAHDPSATWEALARPSHRLREGGKLLLAGGEELTLSRFVGEGRWIVAAPPGTSLVALMERYGTLPLPPYIKTYPKDPESYQTVYAARPGSAAAPTAGLHFTPRVLAELRRCGIGSAQVTLHVGLDTFQPIRESVVEEHRIHRETYFVTADNLALLREARARGRRLVAVGTTAARVLETLAAEGVFHDTEDKTWGGETGIFITPGHRFLAVNALLTNFHLPRSSVLALTMAFAGVERLRAAYEEAIALRYRFFSFGDAMLIDESPEHAETSCSDGGATCRRESDRRDM